MGTITPAQSWQQVFAALARELADLNLIADDSAQPDDIRDIARADAEAVRSRLARTTRIREDPLFTRRGEKRKD